MRMEQDQVASRLKAACKFLAATDDLQQLIRGNVWLTTASVVPSLSAMLYMQAAAVRSPGPAGGGATSSRRQAVNSAPPVYAGGAIFFSERLSYVPLFAGHKMCAPPP